MSPALYCDLEQNSFTQPIHICKQQEMSFREMTSIPVSVSSRLSNDLRDLVITCNLPVASKGSPCKSQRRR